MTCQELERDLTLYIYDELGAERRAEIEAHLAGCAACKRSLEQQRQVSELVTTFREIDPNPNFLVECRMRLDFALEREQMGWRALIRAWLPPVAAAHPARAATALTLVAFGFSLGWIIRPKVNSVSTPPVANVTSGQMTGTSLGDGRIRSISQVTPDPETGKVTITLNAENRVTLEGSLDDDKIRQVLLYAVKSYDNPGIRLDTLSALGQEESNPAVQDALLYVLDKDSNAGVRLQALQMVGKSKWNHDITHAVLQAAEHDSNLGVRESAMNSLVDHLQGNQSDADLVPALERIAKQDADRYVRSKALVALQQVGQEPQ